MYHNVYLYFQSQGGIQYMQTLFLLLITIAKSEKVSDIDRLLFTGMCVMIFFLVL